MEHLKSDCPRKAEKDGRQEVKARRMEEDSIEVEEAAQEPRKKKIKVERVKKKVVNF